MIKDMQELTTTIERLKQSSNDAVVIAVMRGYGESFESIATVLDKSKQAVSQHAKRLGIK